MLRTTEALQELHDRGKKLFGNRAAEITAMCEALSNELDVARNWFNEVAAVAGKITGPQAQAQAKALLARSMALVVDTSEVSPLLTDAAGGAAVTLEIYNSKRPQAGSTEAASDPQAAAAAAGAGSGAGAADGATDDTTETDTDSDKSEGAAAASEGQAAANTPAPLMVVKHPAAKGSRSSSLNGERGGEALTHADH